MNAEEYVDLMAGMFPRFKSHFAMKLFKNVTRSTEPREPTLDQLIKRLDGEFGELISEINNVASDAKAIQMEAVDVAVCAFLIYCLMHDRQTKHPEPRYWRQFANDTGINKEA